MSNEYVTVFPATENPLSESGRWTNGLATGLLWHDVRTTPALAFGTQTGGAGFTDSIAVLSGVPSWDATQAVRATVFLSNPIAAGADSAAIDAEVELLLRFTIGANSATGYECTFSVDPNNPYVQVNRWNGGLGSFTPIASQALPQNGSVSSLSNGDSIKGTICGKHICMYVNDVLVIEVDDTTYSTGNPGIGFYFVNSNLPNGHTSAEFGLSTVTATNYAWARGGASLTAVSAATGTSKAFGALSATPAAGATIIAVIDHSWTTGTPVVSALTDSAGNVYVKDTWLGVNQGGYNEELSVWRAIANGSAVTSITATYANISSGAAGIGIAAYTWGGILNASGQGAALDVNLLVADATSPYQSGTAAGTTDTAFELKLGIYGDGGNNSTLTAGTGFSLILKTDSSITTQILLEELDAGAANGTASAQVTGSSSAPAIVGVVVYRVAGGPPRGIKQSDFPKPLLNTYSGRDGGIR